MPDFRMVSPQPFFFYYGYYFFPRKERARCCQC